MTYRSKNPLGLGQPGYAAERYVPTNLGQANYAAERYVPVSLGQPGYAAERYLPESLGQPGYAAERYIPTNLGRAPYAMERYIPASLGQPGYAAERYVPMSGLGQPGYAAERYLPVSLGQPGYAAERYIPMAGLGQAKTGTTTAKTGTTSGSTTTAKTGTTGGEDTTARDFRTAADVGGSLIGGVVRGFTGGSTTTPATTPDTTSLTTTTEPAPSGGSDWYWPVVISGGLILVGGIGYFALKGKKSAPTPNKRKRVSRKPKRTSRNPAGGMDAAEFCAAVQSMTDLNGKTLRCHHESRISPGRHDSVFLNFFNLTPERVSEKRGGGAEAENNRCMLVVEGFARQLGAPPPTGKVKVTTSVSPYPGKPLRGKTGTPESIAKYVAAYLSDLAQSPSRLTHANPRGKRRSRSKRTSRR